MCRDKQWMTLFVRLPLAGGPDVSCSFCNDRVKSTEGFIRELSTGMGHVSSHPEQQNSFTSRSQTLGVMIRTVITTTVVRTYPKTSCKFNALDRPRPTRPVHACYRLELGQGLRRAQNQACRGGARRSHTPYEIPYTSRDSSCLFFQSSCSSSCSSSDGIGAYVFFSRSHLALSVEMKFPSNRFPATEECDGQTAILGTKKLKVCEVRGRWCDRRCRRIHSTRAELWETGRLLHHRLRKWAPIPPTTHIIIKSPKCHTLGRSRPNPPSSAIAYYLTSLALSWKDPYMRHVETVLARLYSRAGFGAMEGICVGRRVVG